MNPESFQFDNQNQTITPDLKVQVLLITLVRTVFSTANRVVYPFLSYFARGMGVTIGDISLALTARAMVGVVSPFIASLADRYNKRFGMLIGAGLFTAGNAMIWIWPIFTVFAIGMSVAFLGVFVFVASSQAFIGDEVQYQQRGTMIAIVEMNWSLAFIAGVPLVGLLVAAKGWMAPFPLFTILGAASLIATWKAIPGGRPATHQPLGLKQNLGTVFSSRSAVAALVMAVAITAANEVINLMFGVWLEDSYQLKIAALGAASIVIGSSELFGEGLTALFTDKIGKKRMVVISLLLNMLVALSMPWIANSVAGALIGLFLFYITFETMIVSSLPIMTEILPSARATLMGLVIGAFSLGRAVGALLAPLLYVYGFRVNTFATILLNLVALYALTRIQVKPEGKKPFPKNKIAY